MQIHFDRAGSQVIAKVTVEIPTYEARVFSMPFECGDKVYAGLLAQTMRDALRHELEAIRRDEYEAGWNDKTGRKRQKRSWFASTFAWRNRR